MASIIEVFVVACVIYTFNFNKLLLDDDHQRSFRRRPRQLLQLHLHLLDDDQMRNTGPALSDVHRLKRVESSALSTTIFTKYPLFMKIGAQHLTIAIIVPMIHSHVLKPRVDATPGALPQTDAEPPSWCIFGVFHAQGVLPLTNIAGSKNLPPAFHSMMTTNRFHLDVYGANRFVVYKKFPKNVSLS
uniref:Secreted protein n=1 Tax=Panagrellus redivivus TaxID=6233 RepID=A0A7E4ULS6_PANRE